MTERTDPYTKYVYRYCVNCWRCGKFRELDKGKLIYVPCYTNDEDHPDDMEDVRWLEHARKAIIDCAKLREVLAQHLR